MFSQRGNLKSLASRRRKKKLLVIRLVSFSLVLLFLTVGLLSILFLDSIRIKNINIGGTSLVSKEEVLNLVQKEISGRYLFVFPRNNIFIYPKNSIENKIISEYPEVHTVKVSFVDFKSIGVGVVERSPKYFWCSGENTSTTSVCYIASENGFIFKKVEDDFYPDFVTFYGDSQENPIRSFVLENNEFERISNFVERLSGENIKIEKIYIKNDGIREGVVESGAKIIWNNYQDLSLALENLLLLIESEEFEEKDEEGNLLVEYIDIQISNKIFYKPL